MTRQTDHITPYLLRVLLLAGGYFVVGRFALQLSIPPGFAAPVWPSAGIALTGILLGGYRYWPGVFLGSFVSNGILKIGLSGNESLFICVLTAAVIAGGASLQAVVAGRLVRLFTIFPNALEQPKDIGILVCLGGPVGCLASSSVGSVGLAGFGFTPWDQLLYNWLAWWVGDTIGVVTFTPILLLLLSHQTPISTRRKIIVAMGTFVLLLVTVVLFVVARRTDRTQRQFAFDQQASSISLDFRNQIGLSLSTLTAIESYFRSSRYVEYDEFIRFTEMFFKLHPSIHALSWNQGVTDSQRDDFEASIRLQGHPDFAIRDQSSLGDLDRAPRREQYFPVTYVVPYDQNIKALGFDTYNDPQRKQTLDRARESGTAQTTGRISIVQDDQNRYGLLIYHPVRVQTHTGDGIRSRESRLIGYAAGVYLIQDLVRSMERDTTKHHMEFVLRDLSAEEGKQLLYDSRTEDHKESKEPPPSPPQMLQWSTQIDLAGHPCQVKMISGKNYPVASDDWSLWAVLVGGMSLTGLFGAYMLTITARSDVVERLVDEKTNELRESNLALTQEISVREQAEKIINARNSDLETLLYVTSHDLREPLRAIRSFSQLVIKGASDQLDEKNLGYLKRVIRGAIRMDQLFDDILTLSRAQRTGVSVETIGLGDVVRDVLDRLGAKIQETDAKILVEPDLPAVCGDHRWIAQAVYNLVANALKFTQPGQPPRIDIDAYYGDSNYPDTAGIIVRDRGPGISEGHEKRVFELFQRAVGREIEGTGAGLAIVQKIAHRHGGMTWVRPRDGGGAEFTVTFSTSNHSGDIQ